MLQDNKLSSITFFPNNDGTSGYVPSLAKLHLFVRLMGSLGSALPELNLWKMKGS